MTLKPNANGNEMNGKTFKNKSLADVREIIQTNNVEGGKKKKTECWTDEVREAIRRKKT